MPPGCDREADLPIRKRRSARPFHIGGLTLGAALVFSAPPTFFALIGPAGADSAGSASSEPVGGFGRFGLAHVDLLDLHVAREAGVPVSREALPAAVIADRYGRAVDAGAAWNRWSMYWDMIERAPGEFTWGPVDAIVDRDRRHGMDTLAILQGVPSFRAGVELMSDGFIAPRTGGAPTRYSAADVHQPFAPPPRDLYAPIFLAADGSGTDDPAVAIAINPANAWAVYVDTASERYRPGGFVARRDGWAATEGIRAWEIGNEPNLEFFWSGSAAEYARYLVVASRVIKRRDPAATILHGGIADHPSARPWFTSFLEALDAEGKRSPVSGGPGESFDVSAWHWYSYADRLRTGPAEVRTMLAPHGLADRPIWATEFGVPIWSEHPGPCWDPKSPWRATLDEQAAYVLQAMAEGVAADVAALIHFQTYDDCGNGPSSYDAFGLIRNHRENQCWEAAGRACWRVDDAAFGTPRPAFHAFRLAAEALDGASLLWRPAEDPSGWQRLLFYRPPDERVSVVWSLRREALAAEFFGTGPSARIYSPAGGDIVETLATPVAGRLRIDLPPMTNVNDPGSGRAVMAGHPIVVVETDTAAPFRAELSALPERSGGRIELIARAADGGTGVGAIRLLVASAPPAAAADWPPPGEAISWSADPLSGEMAIAYDAPPGATLYFGLIAADRAGNWSAPPATAQAWTIVDGGDLTATPPDPMPTTSPSAMPTSLPSVTPTAPPPGATASPTPPPWGELRYRIHLPAVRAR